MNDWLAVGALALVAVLIPIGMMALSALIRPTVPELSKRTTYESGEVPTGGTRIPFNIQYYMVALLFVIFDIETVLLFPWALVYRSALESPAVSTLEILWPMALFVAILLVGLLWAWRTGAVEWAKSATDLEVVSQ